MFHSYGKMVILMFVVVIATILIAVSGAVANRYTIYAGADATVKSAKPTQNFGTEQSLFAGYSGSVDGNGRVFLYFDLSSTTIPPAEWDYITDVNLNMNVTQSSTSPYFEIWTVGSSWNENTITWNNQPGLSSNIENTGSWGSLGYTHIWLSRLGNAWLRNILKGIFPNNGLIMRNGWESSPSHPAAYFTSRENANPNKPMLEVYTSVAPTPSITITNPLGGEIWYTGETHSITWTSVNIGWTEKIQIIYSPTIGGSEILIAEVPPNYTSYSWTIPAGAPSSNQYRILLRAIYHSTIYASAWSNTFTVGTIPTRTLTVASSNPNSGVTINVSPYSCTGSSTPFTCSYNNGTSVTLTASGTAPNGNIFQKWQRNSIDYPGGTTISVTMDNNYTMTAVYVLPATRTLTVASSNPNSGVTINVSPYSCTGSSTPFTCSYNNGTSVTLTASGTAPNGNIFQKWQRNSIDYPGGTTVSVTMDNNYTMTAVYGLQTWTLTVSSENPTAGVQMNISPYSCNYNTTPLISCTYNSNQSVSVTAPQYYEDNYFSKWKLDGQDYGTSLSVQLIMNNNHNLTAVYATKYLYLKDNNNNSISAMVPFIIYKVDKNKPDFTEHLIGEHSTDFEGKIIIPASQFNNGDWIKITKKLHAEPARKHSAILTMSMCTVHIDNAIFDNITYDMSYDAYDGGVAQTIVLGHTTYRYNLLISIEWDAEIGYLEALQNDFKAMSNYLYDVSDGQIRWDTIAIYDNKENWNEADMQIHANNILWAHCDLNGGIGESGSSLIPSPMEVPRRFFGMGYNADWYRNESIADNWYSYPANNYNALCDYRAKCHEFMHYALGLYDEYDIYPFWSARCPSVDNYGIMDQHAGSGGTEMSSSKTYQNLDCRNTKQWRIDWASCWDMVDLKFEKTYDGIFAPIVRPDERSLPLGDYNFLGPNNWILGLNYDVGNLVSFPIIPSNPSTSSKFAIAYYQPIFGDAKPLSKVDVSTIRTSGQIIYQGQTADNGKIRILGFSDGDRLRASASIKIIQGKTPGIEEDKTWLSVDTVISSSGIIAAAHGNAYLNEGDSVGLILRPTEGYFPLICYVDIAAAGAVYFVEFLQSFSADPQLAFSSDGSWIGDYSMSLFGSNYSAEIPSDSLGNSGSFTIWALDNAEKQFFFNTDYTFYIINDSAFPYSLIGPVGSSELILDSLNSAIQRLLILSSPYPVPKNGLEPNSTQGGTAISVSLDPPMPLMGDNFISIRYLDDEISGNSELLRIYRWNNQIPSWIMIGGEVDTASNMVTARIDGQGVYAAFTTSPFKCGDANGNGVVNIQDITFLINYLYKDGPTPTPRESGDANGNGVINIQDITHLINYLYKEGPAPICP